jgi:pimeloyl-ACP methyl ester carboxylesterase
LAKTFVEVENKNFEIVYDIFNLDKEKNIIFLHGWGSNKEIMEVFKDSLKDYKHIYIDMPGFGKSKTEEVLTTKLYAKIMDKFLYKLNIQKDIIVGHSFGGKVATLLNPNKLVLLSSAGILEEKSFKVKAKIKTFKILKSLGLTSFRKFFVADDAKQMSENMYQTFKNVVDEDFSEEFKKYKNKAFIFWGDKDTAVSVQSGEKMAKYLNGEFYVLEGDHYFFLDKKNLKEIVEKIL